MSLNLYSVREDTTKIQLCCHQVLNRVLDLMVKYPKHAAHLNKYSKSCLVTEKLCDYISHSCCNSSLSVNIMNECREKCNKMIECCENIMSCGLPSNECKYLRCGEMIKLCSTHSSKSSKSSKKSNKKKK
jgi:hypothetical protein